ncbi:hypothetical protein BWI93_03170 [Siphonobacter sp. BAB-5385]|uniref:hypothetical protein n=1 Tax=Siphonobacter sp. BAB-5385 TaxID=1864822 RepID=UPI000B9E0B26|nr:hypothetical protein [Siphonobacter sp. BAB-5385]OZI09597.1 hypothetical protein BWI93_03170 [Siphonobacter sp. BAB-5385]
MSEQEFEKQGENQVRAWTEDWCKFAREALSVNLDKEQEAILSSVQHNPRTSVASGTARGKDFVTAVAAICFMYLTPKWRGKELIENTKVALTAPTDRQVKNIMMPEISRLFNRAKRNGVLFPGRLNAYDIRTDNEEWFLTGFKADEHNHEAWSGFHAVNTMFAITEASGISDDTFAAIEGNLQGNSRILIVFNPNTTIGYAAKSQKGERWSRFRLSSLSAPNVLAKKQIIPGQVDYEWVKDKLELWAKEIRPDEFTEEEDDFEFDGKLYRPEDLCRIKILGKFPKVGEDSLIPEQWIELANQRWEKYHKTYRVNQYPGLQRIGVDVAGMGRDSSCFVHRHDNIVSKIRKKNSGGRANHMEIAGAVKHHLDKDKRAIALIDTIGEGAGVYSRLEELGLVEQIASCKYSEAAKDESEELLTDVTGQYKFANMRAYLFWAVRDWLNPRNNQNAMLPPRASLLEEATEIKWKFQSNGSIIIEPKDEIVKRLSRSPDEFDALANTFYPATVSAPQNLTGMFF